MKKEEAVHHALRAALDSWNWQPPPTSDVTDEHAPELQPRSVSVRTELSATVFSAEATDWVRYLKLPIERRYEPDIRVRLHVAPDVQLMAFEAENSESRWLSLLLS